MSESRKFELNDRVVVYSSQLGSYHARTAIVTKVHKNGNLVLDRDFSRQWRQTGVPAGRNNWDRLRIVHLDSEDGQRLLNLFQIHEMMTGISLMADRLRRTDPRELTDEITELSLVFSGLGGILGRRES